MVNMASTAHHQERFVYHVPMKDGIPAVLFHQDKDETFTLRPDGTYITDRVKPQLEQAGIRAQPWHEESMRVINVQAPAPEAPKKKAEPKKEEKKKSGRRK